MHTKENILKKIVLDEVEKDHHYGNSNHLLFCYQNFCFTFFVYVLDKV